MSSSPKRNLCNLCSKRVNANSKAIQCSFCFRKSHQKCISILGTSDANDKACLHSNYLCVKCVKNTLPFMSLEDNEFQTAIFELQQCSSYLWNLEILNNLAFHPFKNDTALKSKANFIDNFCDPNEYAFAKIDKMTHRCKYYVEDSFKSLTSNRPIEFSLIHFNIRSPRKHFNNIICYLTVLDFHFNAIALSETFLNSNDDIELFALPGYHLPITLNRPNEDGGRGIVLYISNDYNFKKREDLSYNSNETQFTFVKVERKKIEITSWSNL